MKLIEDYNYIVSLSNESFINKEISNAMIGSSRDPENRRIRELYGYSRGISYSQTEVNCRSLLDSLIHGKVFCHLFNPENTRKDGSFGSSEKKDQNFRGSYVIGVDIDKTSYGSMSEFVSTLTLKPSLSYTSYSNMQFNCKKCCMNGARFRLIYVFDELIEGSYYFRYCAKTLNDIIQRDSGEEIEDNCNIRCSQYFNGTNVENSSLITSFDCSNIIYSLSDLGVSDEGYLEFLENYAYYKTVTRERTRAIQAEFDAVCSKMGIVAHEDQEKPVERISEDSRATEESTISPQLIDDMKNQSYDQFMKYNRWKFTYIYRSDQGEWIDDLYQKVDDNYFSLYWNVDKVKDGQKRRKKIYERICLRRVMNPDIDADTLLFCAYEDRQRFFEIDKDLSIDCLVKNVEAAMKLEIPEIEKMYSKNLEYLRGSSAKRGIIFKSGIDTADRNRLAKEIRYLELDDHYNRNLSISENLKNLQDQGYQICMKSLYNYCKERGITIDQAKLTDDELADTIDYSKSANENYRLLRESGIKVKRARLLRIYKANK